VGSGYLHRANGKRYEVFTVMKIVIVVFWIVMPWNLVGGYQLSKECIASNFRVMLKQTTRPHQVTTSHRTNSPRFRGDRPERSQLALICVGV
jgi:hypothetical protein